MTAEVPKVQKLWGRKKPGSYVAISLPSGGYAYGRVLDKLMAFYDFKSQDALGVDDIVQKPIAFIAMVATASVKSGRWPVIGYHPLEQELTQSTKFFRKDTFKDIFFIYVSIPEPPHAYEQYEASPEECLGLEPASVWSAESMEERLEQHFKGEKNEHIKRMMDELKKCMIVH